jgi:hypothetical protein
VKWKTDGYVLYTPDPALPSPPKISSRKLKGITSPEASLEVTVRVGSGLPSQPITKVGSATIPMPLKSSRGVVGYVVDVDINVETKSIQVINEPAQNLDEAIHNVEEREVRSKGRFVVKSSGKDLGGGNFSVLVEYYAGELRVRGISFGPYP